MMVQMIDPDKFFNSKKFCPSCGIERFTIFSKSYCICGWIGPTKDLLDEIGLRKLKLKKLKLKKLNK